VAPPRLEVEAVEVEAVAAILKTVQKVWVVPINARTERHKRERFGALAANTAVKNRDG